MRVAQQIRQKLADAFHPMRLSIVDESHKHAGHAGARPGGETHFHIEIVSEHFEGQSRIARQRSVYRVLADELATSVHALAVTTLTPAEDAARRV